MNAMRFRLACGHTRRVMRWTNFLEVIRERCVRCAMERKERRPA